MPIVDPDTMLAHATVADVAAWTGKDATGTERLIRRASELIDAATTTAYEVDSTTGLAVDEGYAVALRDAVCAQVEHWLLTGESNDIDGMAGEKVAVSDLSVTRPNRLAPRARQQLALAGLL